MLNGLKREELIATNSMLLHELYFASLGGYGQTMESAMRLALDSNFGGLARAVRHLRQGPGRQLGLDAAGI